MNVQFQVCGTSASLTHTHWWRQISSMIHWLRALAPETQRGANSRQPASDNAHSMNKTFVEINPEMGPDEMVTDSGNREFWDRTSCFFRWEMANMRASASSSENECVRVMCVLYCMFNLNIYTRVGNSFLCCSLSAQLPVQPTWRTWRTWMSRDTHRYAPHCACPGRAPPAGRVAPGRTWEVSPTHGGRGCGRRRSLVFAFWLNHFFVTVEWDCVYVVMILFSCCKSCPPSSHHLSSFIKMQNLNSF